VVVPQVPLAHQVQLPLPVLNLLLLLLPVLQQLVLNLPLLPLPLLQNLQPSQQRSQLVNRS
jgi:hypothetical protein